MTIFNVIKYPISDMPTVEQLRALPEELYKKWTTDMYHDQLSRHGHTISGTWYFHPAFITHKLEDLSDYQRNEYVHELKLRIQELE